MQLLILFFILFILIILFFISIVYIVYISVDSFIFSQVSAIETTPLSCMRLSIVTCVNLNWCLLFCAISYIQNSIHSYYEQK